MKASNRITDDRISGCLSSKELFEGGLFVFLIGFFPGCLPPLSAEESNETMLPSGGCEAVAAFVVDDEGAFGIAAT